ncbi:MerR family transcriptional regulator [Austwickia chelonae]|uniref:MerR family transcriptional regulator n=1 Tax=Austwickia chelonae TaxID=100225 RepID=UPI000E275849|nr:HEAT repeat domain-containing protein [Austwickia chelonae]
MLIGEIARTSGVSTRMLRHYDALGLVRPEGRTPGGYRDYSDADIQRLFQVEALRTMGLPLKQIGTALETPDGAPAGLIDDLIRVTRSQIDQGLELLDRLTAIRNSEPTGWADVLRAVELMRDLDSSGGRRRQQQVLMQSLHDPIPAGVLVNAIVSEDDPHVCGALRWVLARSGTAALAALCEATESPDLERRHRAVLALTELAETPEACNALENLLHDSDPTIRRYAAMAVGRQGIISAVPVLVSLIVEGDHDVEAAETLAQLGHGSSGGDDIVAALLAELNRPHAPQESRLRLAQALTEIGTSAAQEVLDTLTRDPDRDVARLASALVRNRPRETRPAQTPVLSDPMPERNEP